MSEEDEQPASASASPEAEEPVDLTQGTEERSEASEGSFGDALFGGADLEAEAETAERGEGADDGAQVLLLPSMPPLESLLILPQEVL